MKKQNSKFFIIMLITLLAPVLIICILLSCTSSCHSKTMEENIKSDITPQTEELQEDIIPAADENNISVNPPVYTEEVKQDNREIIKEVIEKPQLRETVNDIVKDENIKKDADKQPQKEKIPEIKNKVLYKPLDTETQEQKENLAKNEFYNDKKEVINAISDLHKAINKKDFKQWEKYILPESKEFYSVPRKIKYGREIKKIHNLREYFLEIFIPSRMKNKIKKIKYISKNNIKAVDITDDGRVITFYNFVKLNDTWYIKLPENIVLPSNQ